MPNSARIAIAVIIVFGNLLLGALAVLISRQEDINRTTFENVLWITAQTEFELLRLTTNLKDSETLIARGQTPDEDMVENARLRSDILWSRLVLLEKGETQDQMASFAIDLEPVTALKKEIDRFASALDAKGIHVNWEGWENRFSALLPAMHEISVAVNINNQTLLAEEARINHYVTYLITFCFAVVVVGGSLLAWLQIRAARAEQNAWEDRAAANQRLSDAIEALPGGFALFDSKDRLALCNAAYRRLYDQGLGIVEEGRTFEEMCRDGVARGLYPDAEGQEEAWIQGRLEAHKQRESITEQRLSNGVWILATDKRTADGSTVGIRTEITTLKEQEAELAAARDKAEAASRAKSDFLAVMSHEIRTPMNGVMGTLELLQSTELDEQQGVFLGTAQKSAEDLLTLLNDILDLSKMESGRLELEDVDFALEPLLETVTGIFQALAREKGIALTVDIAPALPRHFRGDPGRLRQILLNLVGNAVKFTSEGRVTIHVGSNPRTGEEPASGTPGDIRSLAFSVSDTGVGIPQDKQGYLFQEFTQIDSSYSRRFGGTGLGLAISKKLAELLGGTIDVDSEPGKGSVFTTRLPLAIADSRRFTESLAPQPVVREDCGSASILLVEDSEVNQLVASEILRRAGHSVEIAHNGFDAIGKAQNGDYDVILMDLSMPQMNGVEATRIIRSSGGKEAHVPIIALTANTRKEDRDRCLDSGMNDFLAKPLQRRQLLEAVARWACGGKEAGKEEERQIPGRSGIQPLQADRPAAQAANSETGKIIPAFASRPQAADQQAENSTGGDESEIIDWHQVIDLATLNNLAEDTGPEIIPVLLETFQEELVTRRKDLEQAILDGNIEAATAAAHPMKSTAGTFGFLCLRDHARTVEENGRNGDMDAVTDAWKQLQPVLLEAELALVQFLADPDAIISLGGGEADPFDDQLPEVGTGTWG